MVGHPHTLYFLGDSHLRAPRAAWEAGLFGGARCLFELVGGATAVGLRHPTSKTQALLKYRNCLTPFRPDTIPIFHLGEVDCGFVIWLRAQRYGESVDKQLQESLAAYRTFVREIKASGYAPIVTSATLPTLRDGVLDGEVSLLRQEVKATYRQRTDLTLEYNQSLRDHCIEDGVDFVDFTDEFFDSSTRFLNDRFRHPNTTDHHLHPDLAGAIWARKILATVEHR